ncbi:MAG: glycosyltransferase family 4 protein [Planctomycetaceae bacterium]
MIAFKPKAKLVYVMTAAISAWSFLRGQLRYMREQGYDVTLVSAPSPRLEETGAREGVKTIAVPMRREPSPFHDLATLGRLQSLFREIRPDIVHCGTPKACFLGGLAGYLAGVPVRLMTLHGMRADGLNQPARAIVLAMERASCRTAQQVYCVGDSLRQRALELRLASPEKLSVLAHGTANGIDSDYFSATAGVRASAEILRRTHQLTTGEPVIGFVGRLVRDKGISELLSAFQQLKGDFPQLKLLLVGDFEDYDGVGADLRREIASDPRIVHLGFQDDPRPAYALMSVLALPTYREGYPYVPMEAASMEVPVVATQGTGCVDAVIDGRTGSLVPPRDATALAGALRRYLAEPDLQRSQGAAGRARVVADFRPELIWQALDQEYTSRLQLSVPPQISEPMRFPHDAPALQLTSEGSD